MPVAVKPGAADGDLVPQILDIEGFIARVEPFFEKSGFYEKEVARKTERFGQIAHAWKHLRIAPRPSGFRALHARNQHHPAFPRWKTVVDREYLLATRERNASTPTKLSATGVK